MNTQTTLVLAITLLLLAACAQNTPAENTAPETATPNETLAAQDEEAAHHTNNETSQRTPQLPDGTYTLDTARSTLTYNASRIAGTPHIGTAALKTGTITLNDNTAQGTITIDMTKLTESKNNTRFLTHLASKDFFDTQTHPESYITITAVSPEAHNHLITGDLTIINNTRALTFPATLTLQDNTLHAAAHFTIDRTNWNITYDSGSIFSELGDRAIKDEIGFTLDLTFDAS